MRVWRICAGVLISGLMAALTLPAMSLAFQTPGAFTCPVTPPGDDRPAKHVDPFSEDDSLIYADGIWVTIPQDGMLELTPDDAINFGPLSGWRSTPVEWLRDDGVEGWVIVSGTRLDAESDLSPQTPLSPQRQYVKVGPVTTGLAFPSEGCWEVVGSVGDHKIRWVVEVRFLDENSAFTCPVTFPNTSDLMGLPPFPGDGMVYNENDLWIAIPAEGVLEFDSGLHGDVDEPGYEGWLGFKLHVHRGPDARGNVTITGERLDAQSDLAPTNLLGVEDGYGDTGFLPVSLMIPGEGCWEITANAGESSATWIGEVRIVDSEAIQRA